MNLFQSSIKCSWRPPMNKHIAPTRTHTMLFLRQSKPHRRQYRIVPSLWVLERCHIEDEVAVKRQNGKRCRRRWDPTEHRFYYLLIQCCGAALRRHQRRRRRRHQKWYHFTFANEREGQDNGMKINYNPINNKFIIPQQNGRSATNEPCDFVVPSQFIFNSNVTAKSSTISHSRFPIHSSMLLLCGRSALWKIDFLRFLTLSSCGYTVPMD